MRFILTCLFISCIFSADAQSISKWKIPDYKKLISSSEKQILVLNFWAPFCKPCIEEIPAMIKVAKAHEKNNVKLILVSVDSKSLYPERLTKFVADKKWNAPIAWLDETNADYFCPQIHKDWSGSIPATLIINTATGKQEFTEGEMTASEFQKMLKKVM
jgi:thiol-disulfide isomerase/thioredoxin